MPWALFNRPSIQLGTLKAYVESRNDKLQVHTNHPYLEVASILGPDLYYWICKNPWVSEALYAPLLFPEQAKPAEVLARKYVKKADKKTQQSFDYTSLTNLLEKQLLGWVNSRDWTQYGLIGFSVCFHQLCASLAAARMIKKNFPGVPVVFGGSACGAGAGRSLVNTFDCIDFVIAGEGEQGLLALVAHIFGLRSGTLPESIIKRQGARPKAPQRSTPIAATQLPALDDLPVPDYSDYFSEQRQWFPHLPFIPLLPIEFSRGCWWNKCTFCNLNLQWCGYRHKKAGQMLREVNMLASRHSCLDFSFVDNMLPPAAAQHFFRMTAVNPPDLHFFAEIRPVKGKKPPADIFSIYRRGGLATVQVGIEALSRSLLQKMCKGVSVIENIATMRAAEENTIKLEGNLILHFPGSTPAEAAETLAVLDYVFPYRPLAAASFFLGHDSPVHREPQKYGIKAIVNHANNCKLFPKAILKQITHLVEDYRGDRQFQRKIWKPVLDKIQKWQQYHAERKPDVLHMPLLSYRDGGNFLLVRQELPDGNILHHRLKTLARQIYLFCTQIRTEKELFAHFPKVPPKKILSFLHDLDTKRILFCGKNRYLALAFRVRD